MREALMPSFAQLREGARANGRPSRIFLSAGTSAGRGNPGEEKAEFVAFLRVLEARFALHAATEG
jgi:hypothetical protein